MFDRFRSSWLPPEAKGGNFKDRDFTRTAFPSFKKCHTGAIKVSSNPDVYLGGGSRDAEPTKWSEKHPNGLLIDLAKVVYTDLASNYGFSLPHTTKCIQIHWKDWEASALDATDWNRITEEVARIGEVLIFCQGGHGRTGTAAAILLTLLGKCDGSQATGYVRSNYYKDAVETLEQTEYLDNLLGMQVDRAAPRISFSFEQKGGYHDLGYKPFKRTKEEEEETKKWLKEMEETNYGYGR